MDVYSFILVFSTYYLDKIDSKYNDFATELKKIINIGDKMFESHLDIDVKIIGGYEYNDYDTEKINDYKAFLKEKISLFINRKKFAFLYRS